MTALQKFEPQSLADVQKLGDIFKKSGYFKGIADEAQAITKILYGYELGFTPVVSMMGIYIVDGKPCLSGNLLGALVKRSGKYDYRIIKSTNDECSIQFMDGRTGEPLGPPYEFTLKDAMLAQLTGKENWKKYPKAMLFNRCLSAGVRMYCPDISAAPIYVPEEMGATVNEEGEVIDLPETATVKTVKFTAPTATGTFGASVVTSPTIALPSTNGVYVLNEPPAIPVTPLGAATAADTEVQDTPVEASDVKPLGPTPETEPDLFIDSKQIQKLNMEYRKALPANVQAKADLLLHNFLGRRFVLDQNGNPSVRYIRKSEFTALAKDAIKEAKDEVPF